MSDQKSNLVQPDAWYEALPRRIWSNFEKVDCGDDWFSVYKIKPYIYAIYEDRHFQEVISYLVIGSDRAMMIDSGLGMGNIKAVVDKLYSGEVVLMNTHTHFDHIGGNFQFPLAHVFDNPVAVDRLTNGLSHDMVKENLVADSTILPYPDGFDPETYHTNPCNFQTIDEDFVVDLGNMKFHVIHTPGHSPDSVMYYDEENKIIFTGDTYYPATLYAHLASPDGSTSIFDVYKATMKKVAEKFSDYTVIPSHNEPLRPGSVLTDVSNAFDMIADGKLDCEEEGGLKKYQFDDFAIVTR